MKKMYLSQKQQITLKLSRVFWQRWLIRIHLTSLCLRGHPNSLVITRVWRTPALEASFQFLTRILKSDSKHGTDMGYSSAQTQLQSSEPLGKVGRVWSGVILRSDDQLLARCGALCFPCIVSFSLLDLTKWMALPLFTEEDTELQNR